MHNPDPPIPDAYWVIPGRLLAGEYPGSKEPDEARIKLRRFLDTGVTFFVDLTEAGELEPYVALLKEATAAEGPTVEHRRLAVRDGSAASPALMERILETMDAALDAGHVVYVHCWGGHGRTGTVVGCYLVRQGLTGEQALAEVRRLHATMADHSIPSPERPEQRALVRNWPGR